MSTRTRVFILLVIMLLNAAVAGPARAQERPEAQRVEIATRDGVTLVADWYAATTVGDAAQPAVILMHMLGSARGVWRTLLTPSLLDSGYAALAVDLRGHGQSGGTRGDWAMTEDDILAWLDWLREQPGIDPEGISLVGGSLGANLALRVMAADERIVTAVSLSPYVEVRGMTTDDAMQAIGERPVYLVAAQGDRDPAESVRTLAGLATGDVQMRLYPGSVHGTGMLTVHRGLGPSIVAWLDEHNP